MKKPKPVKLKIEDAMYPLGAFLVQIPNTHIKYCKMAKHQEWLIKVDSNKRVIFEKIK